MILSFLRLCVLQVQKHYKFFCEHVRNGNCFLPRVKYKSYYRRFTTINFAKPS